MGEIWNAVRRLGERKDAVGVGDTGENVGSDRQRKIMVGMDLNIEELHEARVQAVEGVALTLERRGHTLDTIQPEEFGAIIAGMWVDGILTGMMLEEARHGTD